MPRSRPNPRPTDPPPVYRSLQGYFDLSEEERLEWITELLEAINPGRRTSPAAKTGTPPDAGAGIAENTCPLRANRAARRTGDTADTGIRGAAADTDAAADTAETEIRRAAADTGIHGTTGDTDDTDDTDDTVGTSTLDHGRVRRWWRRWWAARV